MRSRCSGCARSRTPATSAVLIVGDYTTRIGDPSGRSSERPVLSDEEIDANAKRYVEQAALIIETNPAKLEVRFNGEWLAKLDFAEILRLTRTITVARILERDDFANRFAANAPISVSELLYPLMQAYDSVAVQADVELGGTDQLYNLLTGRDVMEAYGLEPQIALTTPLLLGSDGEKMSKSKGNTIGLTDPPGGAVRQDDAHLRRGAARVLPARHGDRPAAGGRRPAGGEARPGALHRDALARGGGRRSKRRRISRASCARGRRPTTCRRSSSRTAPTRSTCPQLLVDHLGVESTSAARRLIAQGAVKVGDETVTEVDLPAARLDGALVQAGKRRFARVLVRPRTP